LPDGYDDNGWYFNGLIDDVRIYNGALSGAEITNLYNLSAPPTITIAAPANGSYVRTDSATVITATASDADGINRVEFSVDGTWIGTANASPYNCNWTPKVARSYSILAKAYDKYNNFNTATITVIATGLVGDWKLDAVSGTVAADNSGNDNNGTLVNGPTWTAGQVGNALSFDGVDDYVGINDAPAFNFGGSNFTMSAWINISNLSSAGPLFPSILTQQISAIISEFYRMDPSIPAFGRVIHRW